MPPAPPTGQLRGLTIKFCKLVIPLNIHLPLLLSWLWNRERPLWVWLWNKRRSQTGWLWNRGRYQRSRYWEVEYHIEVNCRWLRIVEDSRIEETARAVNSGIEEYHIQVNCGIEKDHSVLDFKYMEDSRIEENPREDVSEIKEEIYQWS